MALAGQASALGGPSLRLLQGEGHTWGQSHLSGHLQHTARMGHLGSLAAGAESQKKLGHTTLS